MNKSKALCIDIEGDALPDVGFDDVSSLVPEDNLVPFSFLNLVAFLIEINFVGGQGKAGHFSSVIDLVYPWVVTDVSHESSLVTCHPL